MAVENIRGAIEAILFANGASVEFSRIAQALEISEKKVKEHISALIDYYEASGRGITVRWFQKRNLLRRFVPLWT